MVPDPGKPPIVISTSPRIVGRQYRADAPNRQALGAHGSSIIATGAHAGADQPVLGAGVATVALEGIERTDGEPYARAEPGGVVHVPYPPGGGVVHVP